MFADKIHRLIIATPSVVDVGESQRFIRHLIALMSTKIADGLIDPKLVLAWIMGAVGAPGYLIGALVPVREAGALLPQLLLARQIQRRPIRKYFWAGGSFVQGLAALGCAVAALTLEGAIAGWAILLCLAILSVARASCSASYKDVLARTIASGTRGTVSGAAGTVGAALVFGFALLLSLGIIPQEIGTISAAIALAGALWIIAAVVFAGLDEPRDADAGNAFEAASDLLEPLRSDREFRQYIIVRGLLIATALAPPFIVMLSNQDSVGGLGNLGLLLLASSAASILSSYVWGRLSDRSSRLTLAYSAGIASVALGGAALSGILTGGLGGAFTAAATVFAAQIAYEGVRAGRKTHLTDMDTKGGKAVYTALSNTLIGVLLLFGGGFGVLADMAGPAVVLAVFSAMSAVAVVAAYSLSEVQQP